MNYGTLPGTDHRQPRRGCIHSQEAVVVYLLQEKPATAEPFPGGLHSAVASRQAPRPPAGKVLHGK